MKKNILKNLKKIIEKNMSILKEILFTIQRQPDGKWSNNETLSTLFALWIARLSLISFMILWVLLFNTDIN